MWVGSNLLEIKHTLVYMFLYIASYFDFTIEEVVPKVAIRLDYFA